MPLPSLTDAQINAESPMDQAVMKDGLRDRDVYNKSTAPNGGAGIAPNADAFTAGLVSHTHDGTGSQGAKIGSAGIATDAVNNSAMMGANSVDAGKIATTTMNTANLASGAVTSAKIKNTTSTAFSGTVAYDRTAPPAAPPTQPADDTFLGQTVTIANPAGRVGVVGSIGIGLAAGAQGEFHIRQVTASQIWLGVNELVVAARYGDAGSWSYSGRIT